MKRHCLSIAALITVWIFGACEYQKLPLPVPAAGTASFGANDTSYIELNPVWDAGFLGFQMDHPTDIAIGPDGILFVADEGNDRIVALTKAGQRLTGNGLNDIGPVPHPRGLSVDSKLNVLIANGTNTVYCWNQYFNLADIDSVAESVLVRFSGTGEQQILTWSQVIDHVLAGNPLPQIIDILFEKNADLAAHIGTISPIYVSKDQQAQINSVAAGVYGSDEFFITESTFDRISRIVMVPELAIKTAQGAVLFHYQGLRAADIATFGSGSGTADDPWGLALDARGNLYFTQLSGNFLVQKLTAADFSPAYVLYQHPIMDLNRFQAPYDIALDDNNDIFVMDTGAQRVFKFDNTGSGAGELVDLGDRGISQAVFTDARGILATDRVIYVVESGLNQIRRFQYSVSEDDLPDDQKKP